MPDFLSPLFSVQVQAAGGGGGAGFLSDESALGSYDPVTFVWTPGRGADGRITQASFNQLPMDTWVKISGTLLDPVVSSLITAQLPGYSDPGTGDPQSILHAYSGCAVDEVGGRAFFHGGGHTDSAFNGILRLSFAKFQWELASPPDHQDNWPSTYRALSGNGQYPSYSVYGPAMAYANANPNSSIYYDEFFDPDNPLASTGRPTSRHTYSALSYHNGKLRHGVRRYWEWDEATDTWIKAIPFGQTTGAFTSSTTGNVAENVSGTWDEVAGKYICGPANFTGPFWSYAPATQTWAWENWIPGGYQAYYSAMARAGRKWVQVTRPSSDGPDFWPMKASVMDLDTKTTVNVPLPGLDKTKFISQNAFYESCVLAYVPPLNKFLYLMPYDVNDTYAANADVPLQPFLIDVNAGTITHAPQVGAWPEATYLSAWSQIENKLFFINQLSALCMVTRGSREIIIKRVA